MSRSAMTLPDNEQKTGPRWYRWLSKNNKRRPSVFSEIKNNYQQLKTIQLW